MSHCPSCGQYTGRSEACPFCGAHQEGRLSIRAIKIATVLLAVAGLAVLWFVAVRAEAPLVEIGQANAMMNMAYVRLQGRCIRAPTYDPESGYLSFWIDDGTGEMRVSAYRAETQAIIEQGRAPALGDQVEVAGTLRVHEDMVALTINAADQLRIARPEPVERSIGSITPEDVYLRVRVRGEVRAVYAPYEGLTLVTVRDATGSIPVAISRDLIALSGAAPALTVGQAVEVVAAVSLYRDAPQLVPASVADVILLEEAEPLATEKPIGEITTADIGAFIAVRGVVVEIDPFSAGVKYTLDDGTGAIAVLLWQDVLAALPDPTALDEGAEVRAQGVVSQYRGELELIPELALDVQMLAAAPAASATRIGDLTAADVGRIATLRGVLGEPETFSRGVKFPLDDGTGQIVLLLWQEVYDALPGGLLAAGTEVMVTGEIEEYRGELEIVPRADGIMVIR